MSWASNFTCHTCNLVVTAVVGTDRVPHCPWCQQDLGLPIALEAHR